MPIIKANQSAALLKSAIVLDLGDLAQQAEKIRAAAEAQAGEIIAQAGAEAQQMIANAKGQGFEAGQAEGLQAGREQGRQQGRAEALAQVAEQLQALQQNWTAALQDWETRKQELHRQAQQAVLELALALAEKVVRRRVEVDPTVIVAQVTQALAHVLQPTDVTVRICIQDRPLLEEALPRVLAMFPQLQHLQLVDDPAVNRGGCVLSYDQGRIDARIETQLQRMVELLLPQKQAQR